MMGERQTEQAALFYEFSLERQVPADHLLRSIDRFVDLGGVREHLGPYYSETGRPSIDPELMIRMLIVGYCMGIRSERRLCEEVHLNLAYRWFCRLGLEGDVPDHSTFSKNRHGRFRDSDVLRELFETVVARCMLEGLVGGEGFAVDASLIKADANRQRSVPGSEGLPPDAANHAVREYLAVLDDAAFGAATPVVPKFISPADPASRWTGAHGGLAFFAYSTNYLIDLDHAVIMDVEPSTSVRQAEVTAARRMLERTQDRFGIWPERLAADSAYGSADNLAWLVHERGIEPHIPVFDKSARSDGTFERADSSMTCDAISTRVRAVRSYAAIGTKGAPPRRSRRSTGSTNTVPARQRATLANCGARAAVRTDRTARSCAPSMKAHATSPAISPPPMPTSSLAASGRRSKCCSPTSNASSSSTAYVSEVPMEPETSSSSPPPPTTSASSPSSSRCRSLPSHEGEPRPRSPSCSRTSAPVRS
jgi:transposase